MMFEAFSFSLFVIEYIEARRIISYAFLVIVCRERATRKRWIVSVEKREINGETLEAKTVIKCRSPKSSIKFVINSENIGNTD